MRYFSTPESLDMLEREAAGWVGTPFVENSAARGFGVSCHMLVACVLVDCGVIPAREFPTGTSKGSRKARREAMEAWVDANLGEWLTPAARPFHAGDVLTFAFGHMGIVLPPADGMGMGQMRVLHALRETGVAIHNLSDPTWAGSISRVWRPLSPVGLQQVRRADE